MMYDIGIIGSGIVGLASAYQLLKKNPTLKLLMLEKENEVSVHQTGNNSGVIHSGIYYTPGSLKAKNCLDGYKMLLEFATTENIPFEICGKVIVATSESEIPSLLKVLERGQASGLQGLKLLEAEQIKEYEPHVSGVKGIYVPQTGIIDYKAVSLKLKEKIQEMGGEILFKEEVVAINKTTDLIEIVTLNNSFHVNNLITCAGLHSDRIAKMTRKELPLRIIPFRGEYYKLKPEKEYLVKNLVYPVPDPNFPFLGVHFTRMLKGGVESGPNAVLAFKREGYTKSDFSIKDTWETFTWPGFQRVALKYWQMGIGEFYRSYSKAAFTRALQKLIPEIQVSDLIEGGSGVRAQASARDGGLVDDFYFLEEDRIIHVCNAPSPAATASLSIGKIIAEKIKL